MTFRAAFRNGFAQIQESFGERLIRVDRVHYFFADAGCLRIDEQVAHETFHAQRAGK